MSNYIAVDYGTHKSGLAYSVEGFSFAIGTTQTKILIIELEKLIKNKNPKSIILGMPYNIDGTMSKHGQRVLAFQKKLQSHFPLLEITTHDERLTTSEATISSVEDIDAESARLILEDYLEKKH